MLTQHPSVSSSPKCHEHLISLGLCASAGAKFVKKGWGGGAGTSFDAWLTSSAAQVRSGNSSTIIINVTHGCACHKPALPLER